MGSSSFIKEVGRFELLPLEIQLAKAAAPGMVAAGTTAAADTTAAGDSTDSGKKLILCWGLEDKLA